MDAEFGAEYFECKALEKAVEWIEELGYIQVVFELDCDNVAMSINSHELQVHWFNQGLVSAIKNNFSNNKLWFCKLVNRQGNNVAHSLTKNARIEDSNFYFLSNYPTEIIK